MEKTYINIAVSEIKEYAMNNKKHPQEQIDIIKKSIQEAGYIGPVIIDENNTILAGHGRIKAIQQLGIKDIDVIKVSGLTETQKKKYRILDNRSSDFSEYDLDNLRVDLTALSDFSLNSLFDGFDFQISTGQNEKGRHSEEYYADNVEYAPEDKYLGQIQTIQTPEVESNVVRGLLIPVAQEIYGETRDEFLKAMRNGVDLGPLLLKLLKNENSKH